MTINQARSWMRRNVTDHIDECGEVNCTLLAENCCDAFDCKDEGGPLDDETHFVWEVAAETKDWYEKLDDTREKGRILNRKKLSIT